MNENVKETPSIKLDNAVGVEFYQEINGQMYPLKNGAYNPLSLAKVDGGV